MPPPGIVFLSLPLAATWLPRVCTRVAPYLAPQEHLRVAQGGSRAAPRRGAVSAAPPPASHSQVRTSSFVSVRFLVRRQSNVVHVGAPLRARNCSLVARCPRIFGCPQVPCLRNATATGRLPLLVTPRSPAQLPSSRCSSAFSLNQLEITKDIKAGTPIPPSPFCADPHETCAFCTCPQKSRIFARIFAVSPLRSFSAFAIVPNGPSLPRKTRSSFARR